jgi:hypothetical protein
MYTNTLPVADWQVKFYERMFFHRPGLMQKSCWLRANKAFRGRERRHNVFVSTGEEDGTTFVASLIIYFTCVFDGETRRCALIRWYEKFGRLDAATGCKIVKAEMMRNTERRSGHAVSSHI